MHKELLKLKPTRYLCPTCEEWHMWNFGSLNEYLKNSPSIFGPDYSATDDCHINCSCTEYSFMIENDFLHVRYDGEDICRVCSFYKKIPLSSIVEDKTHPIITFDVIFPISFDYIYDFFTSDCGCACFNTKTCNFYQLAQRARLDLKSTGTLKCTLGFEFDEDEYWKIVNPQKLLAKEPKNILGVKKQEAKCQDEKEFAPKQKEDTTMTTNNVTRIFDQLYRHSPEENVQLLMQWGEKYKPALKWAVPLLSVYAAYRILNSKRSGITTDNIGELCEKHLGFPMKTLEDKANLRKLMKLGKVAAIGYGAMKVFSSIYGSKDPKDISPKDVENGLQEMTAMSQKFGWISPMTEKLLPIALCVIVVYAISTKSAQVLAITDKAKQKAGGIVDSAKLYAEMAKLFIADKFHIDLSNEEEKQNAKRFAFLAIIVLIGVLLYGKKMLNSSPSADDTAETTGMKAFMNQIVSIMKKLMPVAFAGATTWLISKKLLPASAAEELLPEAPQSQETPTSSEVSQSVEVLQTPEVSN